MSTIKYGCVACLALFACLGCDHPASLTLINRTGSEIVFHLDESSYTIADQDYWRGSFYSRKSTMQIESRGRLWTYPVVYEVAFRPRQNPWSSWAPLDLQIEPDGTIYHVRVENFWTMRVSIPHPPALKLSRSLASTDQDGLARQGDAVALLYPLRPLEQD